MPSRRIVPHPFGRRDRNRPSAAKRLYDHRWRVASKAFLAEHPLCIDCAADGRVEAATDVDHQIPHRGDERLFWDVSNWRPRCKSHHSRKTRSGQ